MSNVGHFEKAVIAAGATPFTDESERFASGSWFATTVTVFVLEVEWPALSVEVAVTV